MIVGCHHFKYLTYLLVSFACLTASAAPIPLSDLIAGEDITAGPLRFSGFSYETEEPLPSAIEVSVETAVVGNKVRLRVNWPFESNDPLLNPTGIEATLNYRVETTAERNRIGSARLTGDLGGVGILFIDGVLEDAGPKQDVARASLFARSNFARNEDQYFPDRFQDLPIVLDGLLRFRLFAGAQQSRMSFVSNEFTIVVPEPTTAFLISGVLIIGCWRPRWACISPTPV